MSINFKLRQDNRGVWWVVYPSGNTLEANLVEIGLWKRLQECEKKLKNI